jgi:hypothetical protein
MKTGSSKGIRPSKALVENLSLWTTLTVKHAVALAMYSFGSGRQYDTANSLMQLHVAAWKSILLFHCVYFSRDSAGQPQTNHQLNCSSLIGFLLVPLRYDCEGAPGEREKRQSALYSVFRTPHQM